MEVIFVIIIIILIVTVCMEGLHRTINKEIKNIKKKGK